MASVIIPTGTEPVLFLHPAFSFLVGFRSAAGKSDAYPAEHRRPSSCVLYDHHIAMISHLRLLKAG